MPGGTIASSYLMSKQKKGLIVFEGIPGGGKTSVANYIREKFPEIQVISELLGEIDPLAEKNPFSFMDNDAKKYKLHLRGGKNSIMDRGYPATLNWDFVLKELGLPNYYDLKLKWYFKNINKTVFPPTAYFYFDLAVENSLKRKNLSTTKENPWSSTESLKIAKGFYEYFFSAVEPQTKVIRIDANRRINRVINSVIANLKEYSFLGE